MLALATSHVIISVIAAMLLNHCKSALKSSLGWEGCRKARVDCH